MLNIYIASSGGNGYILATKIISYAALGIGAEVKTYIQEGLIQRNGIVFGEVRIGKNVLTGQIPVGCVDIMLGLEPLEAYRKSYYMKDNGIIILNNFKVYPAVTIYNVQQYPSNIEETLAAKYTVVPVDFYAVINEFTPKGCNSNFSVRTNTEFIPRKMLVVNTYCIGKLARILANIIPYDNWIKSIELLVPKEVLEENLEAFCSGYNYGSVPVIYSL